VAFRPQSRFDNNVLPYVFAGFLCILITLAGKILSQLGPKGHTEWVYYVLAGAIVLSSFAYLHRPFVTLCLTLFYLASPIPIVLDASYSAAIATVLIANCFAGTVQAFRFNMLFRKPFLRVPLLLCAVAAFGAVSGIVRGNKTSLVLGDFYQITEFAALFFLVQTLVNTEERFRAFTNVIIGSILATSVLQTGDALIGAGYLPRIIQQGIDVPRTINMNAPIALVALLSRLTFARDKRWILAGMGVLAVNLVWSFTRGLWAATIASVLFLLFIQGLELRRIVLKIACFSCVLAIPLLYASGLGSVIGNRVSYSFEQFGSASEEEQNLAGRRVLEYILIFPSIAEHPVLGNGLGATYEISGSAVLAGPEGEQVDYHYIHNLYLLIAFRLGIPVLLLFITLLWKYFRRSIRTLRMASLSHENSALLAGLIAAMFGEAVLSLTSPTFMNHPTAGLMGCIMAATVTTLRPDPQLSPRA
jgi:O-Antigen ligase